MRATALWILCCLCIAPAQAAVHATDGFELILLDGYEDCPLAYRDADLDTFGGDSDVRIVCGPPPAGFVAIGGDCDDNNALINPAVLEVEPDAQFADENCDGVDGNASLAIFVAQPGSGAANCGSRALPCALSVALARAQAAGRTQAYLQRGDYPLTLLLGSAGVTLAFFGGYDFDWRRANRTTNPSRILGGPVSGVGGVGVQASGGVYRLVDVLVEAPSTSLRNGQGDGLGSYGVRALDGANVTLTRVSVTAGNGAAGLAGANGVSATQTPAQGGLTGGNGAQFQTFCNDTTRGLGGNAGTNPACALADGGNGGSGGTMDTDCGAFPVPNLDARPGVRGSDAEFSQGTIGQGGAGGSGLSACGPTVSGGNGRTIDGSGGGATGMTPRGSMLGSTWVADSGNAGSLGLDGTGGGGGGGAGGCDVGTDSYGAGGGGGGAGGCRATVAGGGGRGGGGSFGVFASNAAIVVQNTTIVRGTGGAGGSGGAGGLGQPGGSAGQVGSNPGGASAGLGGSGGRGGHSGGGSGGAGGVSASIFTFLSSSVVTGNTFSGGAPGAGGAGGSGGVPGADGPAGQFAGTFTCASGSGC